MRQLYPLPVDPVDLHEVYRDPPVADGRPSVRLNMIASIDGATATAVGVSGGLGGPGDKAVFGVLRSLADIVLVAAGTLRAEHYGPSTRPVAVVSGSCDFDWESPFFTAAQARPIVVTVSGAPADLRARAATVADVIVAGEARVDLAQVVAALGERGAKTVLAEGGPSLNGQLAAAGLLDEVCLTVSPMLVGGDSRRILSGGALTVPAGLDLHSVCEEDGYLFLRLRPRRPGRRRQLS